MEHRGPLPTHMSPHVGRDHATPRDPRPRIPHAFRARRRVGPPCIRLSTKVLLSCHVPPHPYERNLFIAVVLEHSCAFRKARRATIQPAPWLPIGGSPSKRPPCGRTVPLSAATADAGALPKSSLGGESSAPSVDQLTRTGGPLPAGRAELAAEAPRSVLGAPSASACAVPIARTRLPPGGPFLCLRASCTSA